MKTAKILLTVALLLVFFTGLSYSKSVTLQNSIYNPGILKPIDSSLKVAVGQLAPDFTLKSITGESVTLSKYRGKKGRAIFCPGSFYPGLFRPVAWLQYQ